MKIKELVSSHLKSVSSRAKANASNFLAELASRNVHRSSFAVTGSIRSISDTLNSEMKDLFVLIQKTNVGLSDLKKLREELFKFTEGTFDEMIQDLKKKGIYEIGGENAAVQFESYKKTNVDEIKTVIEFQVSILSDKIKSSKRVLYWDISKILITAIIGGVIGAYLKSLFP